MDGHEPGEEHGIDRKPVPPCGLNQAESAVHEFVKGFTRQEGHLMGLG
jgi:hypothetical protein